MFTQISQPRFRIMIRGTANYYIILFFLLLRVGNLNLEPQYAKFACY